ncbi:MAG: ABC transporter substrate-binding protein [Nitrospiraceae bacterium]|nr:ABC transporter substrate-binding protein [Nitrospiraceae bacterium]
MRYFPKLRVVATLLAISILVYLSLYGPHLAPPVISLSWRLESLGRAVLKSKMFSGQPALDRSAATSTFPEEGFAVAVVWPPRTVPSYVEGVTLAWEEMNAAKGPLAGKIRLRTFVEELPTRRIFGSMLRPTSGPLTQLPKEVVSYGDVRVVMGHALDSTLVPASIVYNEAGVLFLVPRSYTNRLTNHQLSLLFKMMPGDTDVADAMTEFAKQSGLEKVVVLYELSEQGKGLVEDLQVALPDANITVTKYSAYDDRNSVWSDTDFRPLIAEFIRTPYDAIIISGSLPLAAKLVIDLQTMRNTKPLLATDAFATRQFGLLAGPASNGVLVPTFIPNDAGQDKSTARMAYAQFAERFEHRFNITPSLDAAKGYFAFSTFVEACLISKSFDPLVVATTLKLNKFGGIFGTISFDKEGNLVGGQLAVGPYQFDGLSSTIPES